MAKNPNYKQTKTTNLTIKGVLTEDAKEITYIDEEKMEQTVSVDDLMGNFASQSVTLTIKMQQDEDLQLLED